MYPAQTVSLRNEFRLEIESTEEQQTCTNATRMDDSSGFIELPAAWKISTVKKITAFMPDACWKTIMAKEASIARLWTGDLSMSRKLAFLPALSSASVCISLSSWVGS